MKRETAMGHKKEWLVAVTLLSGAGVELKSEDRRLAYPVKAWPKA